MIILSWFLASTVSVRAQDSPSHPNPPPAQNLANWWLNSSLFYDPLPKKFLAHVEGTLSYTNNHGNIDGSMLDVKVELDLRKNRFTNRFNAHNMRQDTNYSSGGQVRTTQNTIRNRLDYDLTKNFVLVAGVENYHDTVLLIDQRLSYFGGFGVAGKPETRHYLNFTGGLAYSFFRYDETVLGPALEQQGLTIGTQPSSGAVLMLQTWRWQLTKTVTLTEQGLFIDYFNQDLGRRWSGNLDLNVPVSKWLSIAISYTIKSEINRYTSVMGVKPQDRNFTTGIRVSI